jgi:amino acid transporter
MAESNASAHGGLGGGQLSTLHAIGQSLAIGPMLGVGILLAGVSNPDGAAGANAALAVLIASIGVLGLGYAISLFARRYRGAGAIYEYLTHGSHPNVGVFAAGVYFAGQLWIGGAAVYAAFGVVANGFLDGRVGIDVPWWVCALVAAAIVQVLNYFGVRVAIRAMLAFAALSFVPMLVLATAVIAQGGAAGNSFAPFDPSTTSWGTTATGVLIAVTLFIGFEASASISEECRDPHRSVPRAIVGVVALSGAFFVLMTYVITIGFGTATVAKGAWIGDGSYLDTIATRYVGSGLAVILDVVVLLDALAVTLALCVTLGHGFFSLSRDGLLPAVLTRTSKHGTPWVGNALVFASVALMALVVPLVDYTGKLGLPDNGYVALFVAATVGSFLIQLVYLALAVVALRLVARMDVSGAAKAWRFVAVLVGCAIPILSFRGALYPVPDDLGASINYTSLWWALATMAVVAVWFATVRLRFPQRVAAAAAHATAAPAEAAVGVGAATVLAEGDRVHA